MQLKIQTNIIANKTEIIEIVKKKISLFLWLEKYFFRQQYKTNS